MTDFVNDKSNFFLPENLRSLRKRMNWSQEELADRIGLNRGNIASYENSTAEPKICNLMKLAHLFNISVFDLTHNNLRNDEAITEATSNFQSGKAVMSPSVMLQYEKDAEDVQSALKGLECLFRLNISKLGELPPNFNLVQEQFEQLRNLAEHLLTSHQELITFIKSKCKENGNGLHDKPDLTA